MTRDTLEAQRQEIADQNDRMVGLISAVCIGGGMGALVTLFLLLA